MLEINDSKAKFLKKSSIHSNRSRDKLNKLNQLNNEIKDKINKNNYTE